MTAMADRITIVSAERVRVELEKTLLAADPVAGLRLLVDTGLAAHVLPELPRCSWRSTSTTATRTSTSTPLTVLEQAIDLEGAPPGAGPAAAHGRPSPRRRQAPHPPLRGGRGRELPPPRGRRREDGREAAQGAALRQRHDQGRRAAHRAAPALPRLRRREWTDSAVRRYVTDAGPLLERLHRLTRSDCTTRNARKAKRCRTPTTTSRRASPGCGSRRSWTPSARPRREPGHAAAGDRPVPCRRPRLPAPARAADGPRAAGRGGGRARAARVVAEQPESREG